MKLNKYKEKRDFNKTKEPSGKLEKNSKKLRFVVQHHLARKDHYDLRLEWHGVMKSFAVPKGPSYNHSDRRLAIQVEDHPLSYRNFEGTIPKGQYGGGTVMIWDEGYWEPIIKPDFKKQIKFLLTGKRLKGKWALVYFKEDNWLLIKEKDEYKGFKNISRINKSIRTKRTMSEIENNVENIDIDVTNPDKVIFPKPHITKQMIYDYYDKVAERMLPYIENRLISTVRCPNGINKDVFYKKHFENIFKALGKKIIRNEDNEKEDYYFIKDKLGLMGEVQMNSYEFHMWGSKVHSIEKPDIIVFDLDPDKSLSLERIREGVKDLKSVLDELEIKSYLKTSGGKGYHVVAKVQSPSWKKHKTIAENIAKVMENKWPEKYTTNIRIKNRKGKIFVDWIRNTKTATSVAPYSLRLKKGAAVSMPIRWSELNKVKPDEIKMEDCIKRLKRKDPWEGFMDE